ncbi:hypothetical protein NUW54_g5453 [Trametes sanguinea]|uniref:Uncharacterized protein n=1 Tax=Trametes sanguinea TaxID=158606 RepID=A0ACC1PY20_9APHY|nr:hypothetical protein NUW54_g5453 [Trametes sanguinea]
MAQQVEELTLPVPDQVLHPDDTNIKTFTLAMYGCPVIDTCNSPYLTCAQHEPVDEGPVEDLSSLVRSPRIRHTQCTARSAAGVCVGPRSMENAVPGKQRTRSEGISRAQRASKSHAAQRILDQFGAKEETTGYLPKRSGTETRVPQPLSEQVLAANNSWAAMVLGIGPSQAAQQRDRGDSEFPAGTGEGPGPVENRVMAINTDEAQTVRAGQDVVEENQWQGNAGPSGSDNKVQPRVPAQFNAS